MDIYSGDWKTRYTYVLIILMKVDHRFEFRRERNSVRRLFNCIVDSIHFTNTHKTWNRLLFIRLLLRAVIITVGHYLRGTWETCLPGWIDGHRIDTHTWILHHAKLSGYNQKVLLKSNIILDVIAFCANIRCGHPYITFTFHYNLLGWNELDGFNDCCRNF